MKFLLFGTGDYYQRYKHWFLDEEVLALIDNSPEKQGTKIDGIQVLSPEDAVKLDYDYIIVLSFYINEMKAQLTVLGVPERKIIHFYDLHKILKITKQLEFKIEEDGQKKILLLSHDLNLGGPSLALMHMAEVLKQQGNNVVFASMIEGPLQSAVKELGIPVVVDNNLQIGTMDEIGWTHQFDEIVCNTINFYYFLSARDTGIPTIWWLHDAIFFYDGVDKDILKSISLENMKVASVGPVPKAAITTFRKDIKVSNLFYEVDDSASSRSSKDGEIIRCLTIGYVESRKGQDILVDAIEKLSADLRSKFEFYLVGQDSSLFAESMKKRIAGLGNVKITGTMGRQEIYKQYEQSDLFICPSREDPMPTVVTEAMMFSVPVIASSAIGTATILSNKEDCLLFESENSNQLAELLLWAANNREELKRIGKNGRKIYENYFSKEAFENSINELL